MLDVLRHDAQQYPDLVEMHVDGLLGAIAILANEKVSASSPLQLHLPPNPLAALEAGNRKQNLHYLVDAVAQLVGDTAKERPGTVGKALLSTITQIEDAHDELRAALVTALGLMAQNRETLPLILPSLYGAMTCNSQRVRAAAARAYGEVVNRDPDDLPPLLHETFIALLSDPYVIVHWAA
ncbi:MAG: HEAT repeat domain-containing protein [Candidatus Sulfotelmatobacter sp.]